MGGTVKKAGETRDIEVYDDGRGRKVICSGCRTGWDCCGVKGMGGEVGSRADSQYVGNPVERKDVG